MPDKVALSSGKCVGVTVHEGEGFEKLVSQRKLARPASTGMVTARAPSLAARLASKLCPDRRP